MNILVCKTSWITVIMINLFETCAGILEGITNNKRPDTSSTMFAETLSWLFSILGCWTNIFKCIIFANNISIIALVFSLLSLFDIEFTATGLCNSQNGASIICFKKKHKCKPNQYCVQKRTAYLCTRRKKEAVIDQLIWCEGGAFFSPLWKDLDCKASNHSTVLPPTTTASHTQLCPQSPLQWTQVCNFSVSGVMYLAFYFTLIGGELPTYSFTAPWYH